MLLGNFVCVGNINIYDIASILSAFQELPDPGGSRGRLLQAQDPRRGRPQQQ